MEYLVSCSVVTWLILELVVAGVNANSLVIETPVIRTDGLTCWTCPNKTSNAECNNWAPDIACPAGLSVCKTVHVFQSESGSSVKVHKECVAPVHCTTRHVGCSHTSGSLKECVSCCTTPYCNQEIATDANTALQLSVSLVQSGQSTISAPSLTLMLVVVSALLSVT